jgi:F-actin monooxygenase
LKTDESSFKTPVPPPRNRLYSASEVTNTADKMREDARARARLKSNEDLGLSPEEKILMLRRRYNLMQNDGQPMYTNGLNKSDDMKYREKKLSVSKSFNDISRMHRHSKDFSDTLDGFRNRPLDFLSDPNLAEGVDVDRQSPKDEKTSPKSPTKSHRRDSERRKSLIQTVSDFFHKKKDQSASNKDLTSLSPTSASKDRLSETSSTTSMFSRFRLSPKSKESSKDKAKVSF